MFNFEILNLKCIEGKGQLRAFADVCVNGELTIKGIRIIEDSKTKDYWIGYPQNSFDHNGQKKYVAIIESTERLKKQIRDLVVDAYKISSNHSSV